MNRITPEYFIRKLISFVFVLSVRTFLIGQNLVPNSGFEIVTSCPSTISEIMLASPWIQPTVGTPDLFNICASPGDVGAPVNLLGNQMPRSGNGYAGLIVHKTGWNYREYIESTLSSALIAGQSYQVSFYVSLADESIHATADIGIHFSNNEITQANMGNITCCSADISASSVITDQAGWTLISGTYIALGGEQYITIGNFNDPANTNTTLVPGGIMVNWGYYYIDDITVRPDNGCEPINLNVSTDDNTCLGQCTGNINIAPLPGNGPYTYLWSPFVASSTDSIATGLCAGTYEVTINSGNGCDSTMTFIITEPPALSSSLLESNILCFGDSTGSIDLTVTGGSPGYLYAWNTGQTTEDIAGLIAGNFDVTIEDDNGCLSTQSIMISEPQALNLMVNTVPATCNQNNGSATISSSGGQGPYSYSWNDAQNQTAQTATGLLSGNYNVIVNDDNGCSKQLMVTVNGFGGPSVFMTAMNGVSCYGLSDGMATAVGSGGTGLLSYQWNPSGGTNASTNGLTAGTYTVTVSDINNCMAIQQVIITEPDFIFIAVTSDSSHCGLSDGQVTASASGGIGSVDYLWNDLANQSTPTAVGLAAGQYTVSVIDSNGCSSSQSVELFDIPGPTILKLSELDVYCKGGNIGEATALAATSSPPLVYQWDDVFDQQTPTATNLTSGTYTVTITDANGCTTTETVTITEPGILTGTLALRGAGCGVNDGQATATPAGGTGPYIYSWDNDIPQASNFTDTLSPGVHTVTITDSNGCDTTYSFTITNPNAPTLLMSQTQQILCNGDGNAVAQATALGGNGPYTYQWDDPGNQNTQIANNLAPGNYTVTVTDANNCVATEQIVITEPLVLLLTVSGVDATCDKINGSAGSTVQGGTSGYSYQWGSNAQGQTTPLITNLSPANYTLTVTDQNGCITKDSVVITMLSALPIVQAWPDTTITQGESVQVNSSGGTTCEWTPQVSLNDPSDCSPIAVPDQTTTYIVTVTDQNGCKNSDTITIIVEESIFTIFIPNAFTPNSDNKNEYFDIRGIGIAKYTLQIFDRWGEMIFESTDINKSWDGLSGLPAHSNEEQVQQDVYVYTLGVINLENKSFNYLGRISVLR